MAMKVVDKTKQFIELNDKLLDVAVARMAQDVKILSTARVPFKSGQLQRSGKIIAVGSAHYKVEFDEDYAAFQERGARKDGTHRVRKYSTPSTGKNFLKQSGQEVTKKASNYIVQAASRVHV